jgi:hypothetical protein
MADHKRHDDGWITNTQMYCDFGYAEIYSGLTEWLPFFSHYDLVQVIMRMATEKCVMGLSLMAGRNQQQLK